MVALKLWAVLKKMLTNKKEKGSLNESTYIWVASSLKERIISVNALEELERIQETINIENEENVEL